MARRIKLYPLVRKVHLYSAFLVMTFLLMYFLTGFVMAKFNLFPREMDTKEEKVQLSLSEGMEPETVAVYLQERFKIPGQARAPQQRKQGHIVFEYNRPGSFTRVTVAPDRKNATIEWKEGNWIEVFHGLHRVHGYGKGFWFDTFVFFMDLTSIGLLVFTISGIYLWLGLLKNKFWGWLCLSIALAYTLLMAFTFLWW